MTYSCDDAPMDRKHAILVVEDQADLAEMFRLWLDGDGFMVRLARDGEEAVQVFRENGSTIDIVLLDYHLPKLDGLGALRAVRELNPSVLTCLMTGVCNARTEEAFLESGASLVLQKPFALDELSPILRRLLVGRAVVAR